MKFASSSPGTVLSFLALPEWTILLVCWKTAASIGRQWQLICSSAWLLLLMHSAMSPTGNGRACEEPRSLASAEEQSTSVQLRAPGYLCPFQFGAPPRRTATAAASAAATLSRFHSLTCPSAGATTAHLVEAPERQRHSFLVLLVLFHLNQREVQRGPVVCSARRHLGAFRGKKGHILRLSILLCVIRRHLLLRLHLFICFAVQSMPPMAKFVAKQIPLTHSFFEVCTFCLQYRGYFLHHTHTHSLTAH